MLANISYCFTMPLGVERNYNLMAFKVFRVFSEVSGSSSGIVIVAEFDDDSPSDFSNSVAFGLLFSSIIGEKRTPGHNWVLCQR